ncbi:AraC family ligand binding domain-containing protein [Ructibacterium gallinarum]|uniref:AraC family ligand binding domain-containing protein n=1 Tax=Ructibacterium gallinarum TaxID=2779355 RepID=A0A9D5RBY0_9FIRM|nr:AraC family ligand binding domain-containing protein [Ructibacterium gallinarum]MBE5040468.1 AraC family ligand binding domain-containing protein [Ructibacterium gallinarum]
MDNFLILYTVACEGELDYEGKRFLLRSGTAAMIHCSQYQIYRTGTGGRWKFYWVHLNGSGVLLYYRTMFESRFFVLFGGDGLKEIFDRLFAMRPEYSVAHELKLILFIHEFLDVVAKAAIEERQEVANAAVR